MSNDSDSHELLAIVAAVHHQRIREALNDWALCLAEALHRVATGGVWDVDGCANLNVIAVSRISLAKDLIVLIAV